MRLWLLVCIALSGALVNSAEADTLSAALACRQESAPLLRLDCYDRALSADKQTLSPLPTQLGIAWQRAMMQEQKRDDHSTAFMVSNTEGDNPQVVLTTPAIGMPPPRPVLVFSCVDNITRLQIALTAPLKEGDGAALLTTERTRFSLGWFVRENGYLLEASRGLAGIDEIQKLFGAQTLTLTLQGSSMRLVFNISDLAQAIEPLKNACHW